jgi:hypothetical protein
VRERRRDPHNREREREKISSYPKNESNIIV